MEYFIHRKRLYVSETWVTKQLLPDLQAVCAVTFSGEKVVFYFFNMDYGCLRQRCGIKQLSYFLTLWNSLSQSGGLFF